MNFTKKLTPMMIAGAMAASAFMAVPMAVQAETSASLGFSNMYLWRGLNLSPNGSVISGSFDYGNEGFYAGMWTTSEDAGSETDLYLGYGGEISGVTYDVSYWKYLYPEERDAGAQISSGDSDAAEYVISLGYGPVTYTTYLNADSDNDDNTYSTLSASYEKFTATYGFWDLENPKDPVPNPDGVIADEYTHITLSYAATDDLSFSISKASSDRSDDLGVEEDPLFSVNWGKSFDLK